MPEIRQKLIISCLTDAVGPLHLSKVVKQFHPHFHIVEVPTIHAAGKSAERDQFWGHSDINVEIS